MTILRPALLSLVAVVLLLVPTAAWAVDVAILDDGVDPDPIVVQVGDAVVFTNEGSDDVRLIDDDDRWDSGDLAPGESFRITFDVEGAVTFTSEDGSVTGTIEVLDGPPTPSGTETTEPTAEPTDEPTAEQTVDPSDEPTAEPTDEPAATDAPTEGPMADALAATGLPGQALLILAVTALLLGGSLLRRTRQP